MALKRIIPCLLLRDEGLVKTQKFKNSVYVGDPINTVKIFNEKEVDELIFLDIDATNKKKEPPYHLIEDIATECFMPFCYGGGIKTIDQIGKIIASGAEKVAINSEAYYNPELIKQASEIFGSSTIVVSIDYKNDFFGKKIVYVNGGKKSTKKDPITYAKEMEALGAGEIFLNSISRDGMKVGLDIDMIKEMSETISIPVVACGGVESLKDIEQAFKETEVTAIGAGSFFVFQGKRNAVLISYPSQEDIEQIIN
ncbi:imidazole glycerol phosphate synthase subunit HisF [Aquimarina sp. MAR_2010_214]|uniref:AglZ/HisF2 family acetamidino modification protein n=1 Tax=Aquimarina sp. MAR_2010_214 TaxID=1250026 RepID=UPI000C713A3A|nr:AglZ/HisF2 family acetamidino modification protein [Aquimarina sp. MAR_2010_214]PKV48778.1 imidazole glycerol phosphate synthase subunit HisF [Aquimarina sp. MAR_2010_214]